MAGLRQVPTVDRKIEDTKPVKRFTAYLCRDASVGKNVAFPFHGKTNAQRKRQLSQKDTSK